MKAELLVVELERALKMVNRELKRLLPKVYDSDVEKELRRIERLSYWKRGFFESDLEAIATARERATLRAKEYGEPFVVVENNSTIVLMPKGRLLKYKPFGFTMKDVVFETGKGR